MSFDEPLDAKLKAIARMAAPGPSIADEVMRRIGDMQEPGKAVAPRRPEPRAAWRPWRRAIPAAASIGLAAGLLLGLGLSRMRSTARTDTLSGLSVPIEVTSLRGTVLLKRSSNAGWIELAPSSPLYVGDVFQTSPKAEMTLSFKDGSTLVLSANSRLLLEHYDGGVRLDLNSGGMKASLNSPHPPFIVSTPNGQLEAMGTEFTVSVE